MESFGQFTKTKGETSTEKDADVLKEERNLTCMKPLLMASLTANRASH